MLPRIVFAVVLVVAAAVIAALLDRRRSPEAPTRDRYPVPRQLDRNDFARPEAPWIVVLFSSTTCQSCASLAPKVAALESAEVAVHDVEFHADPALHERYEISGIPTTVIADADGVVRAAFIGSMSATDLWAAAAEVRSPGSTPEPDLGRSALEM